MAHQRTVAIYRTKFPMYSEAFISEQVSGYSKYRPVVLCREYVGDMPVPDHVTEIRGKLRRGVFSVLGRASEFRPKLGQASLVHAHFAPDALLVLPLADRHRIPLVVTCHGSDVTRSDRELLRSGRAADLRYAVGKKRLQRSAGLFIAVSDFVRGVLLEAGYPEKRVVRHYIGVDTERLRPIQGTERSMCRLVSVARHEDVKGVDLLLRAISVAAKQCPELRLSQIGGGTRTQELRQLSRDLGIEDRVEFLGVRSHHETLALIRSASALVLSSRRATDGAEEALGIVLLEAAACGIPVVATRVGGIPEAVRHLQTGLLVPSEDVEELASALVAITRNCHLNRTLGEQGRAHAVAEFDLRKQTSLLEAIYDQVIAEASVS